MGILHTAIRKAKHTQASLAREVDVTPQAINQWVQADKVPPDKAAKVERLLGINRRRLCPDFPWDE